MAVYPDDSKPVPDGALVPSDMKALQKLDEKSVKDQIRGANLTPWWGGRDNFFTNIIGGIGQAFIDGLTGAISDVSDLFNPIKRAAEYASDGQSQLNDRVDLLSPILDYGSAFMPAGQHFSTGIVPFTNQIGPMRGCSLYRSGIRLHGKGLWDIRVQVTVNAVPVLNLYDMAIGSVRVFRPNGTEHSRQTAYISSRNADTMTIVSSVVCDEDDFYVQMWIENVARGRELSGGPRFSRLSVQHISRFVTNEIKDGNDDINETPNEGG